MTHKEAGVMIKTPAWLMKSDVLTIDSAQYDQKRCCDEG
jgi:hypothetical protein